MTLQVIRKEELPATQIARQLVGGDHGGLDICIIFVDARPGEGPAMHKHPYAEVFITLDGSAAFVVGDEKVSAGPGDIAIVPAETPHSFTSSGPGNLRQIDIHLSRTFITDWL